MTSIKENPMDMKRTLAILWLALTWKTQEGVKE